ncbi:hypothetical protein BaRGS_00027087 [Batillaria attramentaria]|uniref:Phosphoenolpyruvate synthase n=1 Tax=Batillaria attramentaria TaxID=370345 RepID=A0ABD0K371_9CAEN
MMDTFVTALVAASVVVLLFWLLTPNPGLVAGVYPLPGRWYWLKRAVFLCIFRLRSRKQKSKKRVEDRVKGTDDVRKNRGLGRSMSPADMEYCQPLPDHPYAMDSVYIGAYSQNGPNFALRVARRSGRQAEIWLILDVPGVGVLQHPVHPDTLITNTDPNSYSAGGLRFEVVEPMKTWRVSYSGPLRVGLCNSIDNKPDTYLDTSFSFQWDAFALPFNYDSDLDPALLGDAVAREKWTKEYFEMLQSKHQTHYEQWGELRGALSVEGRPSQQLCMKAIRDHSFGVRKWTDFYRYIYCFLYIENGTTLQVGIVSQPGMLSHLKTGCLTYPNGEVVAVTRVDFNLWEVGETEKQPPAKWAFTFMADGQQYSLSVETKTDSLLYHEADRGGVVHEVFCAVTLNNRSGWGLSEFFYRNDNRSRVEVEATLPLLIELPLSEIDAGSEEFVMSFTAPACSSSALVGGKGSQLAQLTWLSQRESVHVPPGICVTLAAFEEQLKHNPNLSQALNSVVEAAVCDVKCLEGVCGEAVSQFTKLAVCAPVVEAVSRGLKQVFGDNVNARRVAVRSSAAGEDGSEASSAGQMETFLGVCGHKQIIEAVQKCWASAYTYQAVEYRRQHGQPIRTAVGVVIQEMVPAEAAGVLFTSDPVTDNSSIIVINANFGLGESVVSGKCEPDTITVRRNWDGSLRIMDHKAGHKQTKVTMKGDGGVVEEMVSSADSNRCCLTDNVILSLAQLGVQVEKYYGSARDIEWAYTDGKIFLLQARPITTAEQETEEELMHEFDSPLAGGYEWLTTGNISEMLGGAVTPLTASNFQRAVDLALQKEVMELNLLGEVRPDLSMQKAEDYLGVAPAGPLTHAFNALRMMRHLNGGKSRTKRWEERLSTYKLGEGATSALELYQDIDKHLQDYNDVWSATTVNSAQSGSWSTVLLSLLSAGSTDWTTEHYSDIALLLSQCQDVYSAEVPTAMQTCVQIMRSESHQQLKQKTEMFLQRHGHRCVREAELREKSWHLDPTKLTSVLKTILETRSYTRTGRDRLSAGQLVAQLKTPLSFAKRKLLQYLLPKAWAAVGSREWGKSLSVLMSDIFKCAYWKLAAMMVTEGRLPDEDLLFFLTHSEIGKLLTSRSARLIVKAQRRRKVLSKQSALHFPKISTGHPVPLERETRMRDAGSGDATVLTGMPVSRGVVEGPARIVLSLAEAHTIQAGDVLVVTCTDVGWTPYFPLIAGLVTELGGLVSHGAVVAREYGIPCVVNIPDATVLVPNGARVELDGGAGTVTVLSMEK